jgi:hypothetical protein
MHPREYPTSTLSLLLKRYFGCHARRMMRDRILCGVVAAALACSMTVAAQDKGNWRATSSTAQAITGDVGLSVDKLFINFTGFPIALIRILQPAELNAVFQAEGSAGGSGNLYRLDVPAAKKFMHHNTLCGSDDTQWMATYVAGHSLHLAFFSGQKPPVLTPEAISNSTDLCGTFLYSR